MNLTYFALKLEEFLLASKELGAANTTEAARKRKEYYDKQASQ